MNGVQPVASASEGLRRVLGAPKRYALVSLSQTEPGVIGGRVAVMTAFGPSVREIENATLRRAREILTDIVRAGRPPVVLLHVFDEALYRTICQEAPGAVTFTPERDDEAFVAFQQGSQEIVGGADGMISWWSVAPQHPKPFEPGDVLVASIQDLRDGCQVRYFGEDGRDAGLHAVFDRRLGQSARELVADFRSRVTAVVFGTMPAADGELVIQTLTFPIPAPLARALSDGKLPRHGGLTAA